MKLDSLSRQFSGLKDIFVKHALIIFVFFIVGLFGFMTFNIARFANQDPTESQKDETISAVKTVKLDEKSIQKIQSLQDQNISIESLFDNGRANPFQ